MSYYHLGVRMRSDLRVNDCRAGTNQKFPPYARLIVLIKLFRPRPFCGVMRTLLPQQ